MFISDVHLGAKHCHAAELADFLDRLDCRALYLVGDIVDLWWMSARRIRWQAEQMRVIEALHALHRRGTRIVYVPGNHDGALRRFCGLVLPGMQVRRRAIHRTADGRRLLVIHGDDYDAITRWGPAPPGRHAGAGEPDRQRRITRMLRRTEYAAGNWLYYRLLTCNRLLNRARRRLGLRYWSLSLFLKRHSSAAERYIARFMSAGLTDAARRGLDGIVCGHIHRAALCLRDGMLYANDGDWVESLTALTEDAHGVLRLITHQGEVLADVAPRLRLASSSAEAMAA